MSPLTTSLTTLLLAALATAAPLIHPSEPCFSATKFTLTMPYNNVNMTLIGIDSGTLGTLNIVGSAIPTSDGTPVIQTGTTPNATLALDICESADDPATTQRGEFGIYVPDLGEVYGAEVAITGVKDGVAYPHFSVESGQVWPMLTAASQGWYACNITVLRVQYVGLSWGLYNSNGSSPWGCAPTALQTNYNVPCGA